MSEIALNPFSYGILRLATLKLESAWSSGAWLPELRALDHAIEYESRLQFARREVYILFIDGDFYIGRSVLGDPFSLEPRFPIFDLELASTFPENYPKLAPSELKGRGVALCPLDSSGLFAPELPPFYRLAAGTLALVNS